MSESPSGSSTESRGLLAIAARSILFTFVMPGTVAGYLPWAIVGGRASPATWHRLGLVPLLIGLAIYVWCVADFATQGRGTPAPFDPPKDLVSRGLYRYTRNPMYVGVLSVLVGEAWLFASAPLALYTLTVFAAFYLFVLGYEEPTLRKSFGASYERYCSRVPRWLPRPRRA